MMGLVVAIQLPRTFIWLRTIDARDQKKNFHQFINRRSVVEPNHGRESQRNSFAGMRTSIGSIGSRVSRTASQIVGFKKSSGASIVSEMKTIKFWTMTFWMAASTLPFFSFISVIYTWASDKGIEHDQIMELFDAGGWMTLSSAPYAYLLGGFIQLLATHLGFQKAVLGSMTLNMVLIVVGRGWVSV